MKPGAFTLAELLIALAILGVVATFTIPKILIAQADADFKAKGKEAAGILTGILQQLQADGKFNPGVTKASDFTPYLNYVSLDSVNSVDHMQANSTIDCSNGNYRCYRLANGGVLLFWYTDTLCSDKKPSAIPFFFDPDGKVTAGGASTGPGKAVKFYLYGDGTIRTQGTVESNTTYANPGQCGTPTTTNPSPANDPPWFSWN